MGDEGGDDESGDHHAESARDLAAARGEVLRGVGVGGEGGDPLRGHHRAAKDLADKVPCLLMVDGDNRWGNAWNDMTLAECGDVIDFGIVHWYPDTAAPQGRSPLPGLLAAPKGTIPIMVSQLRAKFAQHGGDRTNEIELVMTEVGPGTPDPPVVGRGVALRLLLAGVHWASRCSGE